MAAATRRKLRNDEREQRGGEMEAGLVSISLVLAKVDASSPEEADSAETGA